MADKVEAPASETVTPDYQETIKVLVGPTEEVFNIHKATICAKSPFFKAACSGDWQEAKDKVIRLPEVPAYSFAIYAHWVYTDQVSEISGKYKQMSPYTGYVADEYGSYICAYVVADVLGDVKLKNCCMDLLIKTSNNSKKLPADNHVVYVWSNTHDAATLRRWLVDEFAAEVVYEAFKRRTEPEEFASEVVKAVFNLRGRASSPAFEDRFKYHEQTEKKQDKREK